MRQCFIHIGTHKTGTTSLQYMLSALGPNLQKFGYLFPRSGRPPIAPHGHHNLAWEISNDSRFLKENGCIDDLLEEIRDHSGNVVLSSEDFECSAHHPRQFAIFIEKLIFFRFDVRIIVYFRNQIEYAESLYLTMLIFGLAIPFQKYLDEILESGKFCWRDWTFPFDYKEFLLLLRRVDGIQLSVRSYDELKEGALVGDFLSILGLRANDLAIVENVRLNERRPLSIAIETFYRNCVGRPLCISEKTALDSLLQSEGPSINMDTRSKLDLIDRFEATNKNIAHAYGLSGLSYILPGEIKSESMTTPSMNDVFSSWLFEAIKTKANSVTTGRV